MSNLNHVLTANMPYENYITNNPTFKHFIRI